LAVISMWSGVVIFASMQIGARMSDFMSPHVLASCCLRRL
jgi:hypothetical protein